jgi:hypothetical protein
VAKTDEKKILQSLFKEADRLNRLRQPTTSFFTKADIKKILDYITKYHDGNLSAAASDLGVTRVRVKGLLDRRGIKLDRAGNKLISKLALPEGTGTYPNLTTQLKKDPSFLRNKITQLVKEGKIKPNARYNVADLGKILNIDVSDKQVRSFLTGDLKKLGVISSTSGKEKIKNYKLSDVVNKLIEKSKTKKVKGQAIADTERLKIVSKIDPELNKLINNTNSRLRTIANETGLASKDLFNKSKVEDVGHAMSVKITDKDKFKNLFKNSNINKINTLVFQDPEVNRVVLNKTGYEAKHERLFNELNTVLNKKITPLDELKLKRIKKELNELHIKARSDIKNLATTNKYFRGQENRLPKIDINIPKIGETFKSSDLFADMSGVDEAYRVGQVHKINPNAKFLKDLNAQELGMFQETFANQNADNAAKFFTKAQFPIEDIKEFREAVEIGTDSRLPVVAMQAYNNADAAGKIKLENRIGCSRGCFIKTVKEEPQKLIRLFRGEPFGKSSQANIINDMAKRYGISKAEAGKKLLQGQWFSTDPMVASGYTDKLGKLQSVDVTPREFLNFKKYVDRVNKTKGIAGGERYPINTLDKLSIVPRYKLDELEKAKRLKTQRNLFKNFDIKSGFGVRSPGVLTYDNVIGGFVDSANPGEVVGQNQIKAWADDNPMPVKAGTEDAFKPVKKNMLKTIGKSLAYVGAPLPTAIIDSYFIGKQIAEDRPAENIAKDPLNWLGLATMSTLSDISGVSQPGKINTALRLGMSPGLIRGISRFAGLPGLAISTALTAYDQYQKYKNEEGLIYNLFNKKPHDYGAFN